MKGMTLSVRLESAEPLKTHLSWLAYARLTGNQMHSPRGRVHEQPCDLLSTTTWVQGARCGSELGEAVLSSSVWNPRLPGPSGELGEGALGMDAGELARAPSAGATVRLLQVPWWAAALMRRLEAGKRDKEKTYSWINSYILGTPETKWGDPLQVQNSCGQG